MIPLNSDACAVAFVLQNHPDFSGAAWRHGYEPDVDTDSLNYEGLIWESTDIDKPSEAVITQLWNDTYRAQWQQNGFGSPWTELRIKRDRLIAETDWWATSDRTMTAEQTAYRQALRDLPANTTDPENPVWPVKPE